MRNKLRVAVVFGGRSSEHEVSLLSAATVMGALDPDKYEVIPIGIDKDGRWLTSGDPMRALRAAAAGQPAFVPSANSALIPSLGEGPTGLGRLDVVFPVLHGPYGEDGTLQGLLELAQIPYVGAGVLASAVGMDKAIMKDVFRQHGIPMVPHIVVSRRDWRANRKDVLARIEPATGYSCFVKPANLGSSVGVSKVNHAGELTAALDLAAEYDRKIVVEQAVSGCREIEVSVLGNDDPIASLPGEIVPGRDFYDYAAKYLEDSSRLIIPADLPPRTVAEVRRLALAAFKAIDCAGLARVDSFLSRDTGCLYVNEVNTMPGFTRISMYPKLWEATGIGMTELVDRLIALAIERFEDKRSSRTTIQ